MSSELVISADAMSWMPALTLDQANDRYRSLVVFVQNNLKKDMDYGIIPGSIKPTLLQPGAEKLCTFFGLSIDKPVIVEKVEDWVGANYNGEPFFYYLVRQDLSRDGKVVASRFASCNSWEEKYRYRNSDRLCPKCKKATIIKGKAEFGGGYVCFMRKGGCGAKFRDGDHEIEGQTVGQVKNSKIFDQVNTLQQMATKRAFVAVVKTAVNASEFFTQDLEDMQHEHAYQDRREVVIEPQIDDTWLIQYEGRVMLVHDQEGLDALEQEARAEIKSKKIKSDHPLCNRIRALSESIKAKREELSSDSQPRSESDGSEIHQSNGEENQDADRHYEEPPF